MDDLTECNDKDYQPLRRKLLHNSIKSLAMAGANFVRFKYDVTLLNAMTIFKEKGIASAPVFDDDGKYHGICDAMMLVRAIARLSDQQQSSDKDVPMYVESSDELMTTTLRDLTHGKFSKRRILGEYDVPINEDHSIYSALVRMAECGTHHLAVCNDDKKIVNLISQSSLVNFVSQTVDDKVLEGIKVSELRPYTFLSTIDENAKTALAFSRMDSRSTSLNSLAVTARPKGRLVDVISTSDFKGLLPTATHWSCLWKSVSDFKKGVRDADASVSATPVVCTRDTTLVEVIKLMRDHHTHRVFVVTSEEEMIPIDVVTMTDLIRFFAEKTRAKAQMHPWW